MRRRLLIAAILALSASGTLGANSLMADDAVTVEDPSSSSGTGYWVCVANYTINQGVCVGNPVTERPDL